MDGIAYLLIGALVACVVILAGSYWRGDVKRKSKKTEKKQDASNLGSFVKEGLELAESFYGNLAVTRQQPSNEIVIAAGGLMFSAMKVSVEIPTCDSATVGIDTKTAFLCVDLKEPGDVPSPGGVLNLKRSFTLGNILTAIKQTITNLKNEEKISPFECANVLSLEGKGPIFKLGLVPVKIAGEEEVQNLDLTTKRFFEMGMRIDENDVPTPYVKRELMVGS